MKKTLASLIVLTILGTALPAGGGGPKPLEQWQNWRGPLATGVAPFADPPINWDEKTNIKWKIDLKLEMQIPRATNFFQFLLICFDRQTGKVRWEKLCKECVPHEGFHQPI